MIPASGAGGHEFDSRIAPLMFFDLPQGKQNLRFKEQSDLFTFSNMPC
jgi:hypothetical protein